MLSGGGRLPFPTPFLSPSSFSGHAGTFSRASAGPGTTAALRAPSACLCHQSGHRGFPRRNRPFITPVPASGVSLRRCIAPQLLSAGTLESARGRGSIHSASSSQGAAAPLSQAARSAYGARPQFLPGFSPHPVTPPVQRGRARRGRRSDIGSAAGAQLRPPFCFRGPDGPQHGNGARFP
ncbi:hypothetical protein NDU88_002271 [Pleurodeles waltl]|uniref:Uncharacterized protein n=1 Tax=Pleurodeles waltl TaxID=8319 RepID=A0AAV7NHH6_PLEWA|nr:hypothetical protein NDU88_002271 [Pleurodeles waltl]